MGGEPGSAKTADFRLRVHGEVVPDPRFLDGTVDLLAAENGGRLVGCSDAFYASPANIILPTWQTTRSWPAFCAAFWTSSRYGPLSTPTWPVTIARMTLS